MSKFFVVLVAIFSLVGCDNIGSTRVRNLIDLTPKLEVEQAKAHLFSTGKENPFKAEPMRYYTISKRPIITEPAIANGIMYSIDSGGYVNAFSLKDQKPVWVKNIATNEVDRHFNSGGILFSDGKLYVVHGTRNLLVLDANTGNEIIRKEFSDILRSKPVMVNDKLLLVQTVSNQLVAYNVKSSKLMWMHEGGIEVISSKNRIHPVVYNGHVLASYSSGEVVYLDANTGTEIWRYGLSKTEDLGLPNFDPMVITTTPVIDGNFVYFATSNGKIVKIDLHDGAEVWAKLADDIQSMIMHDNHLIVTTNARQVAVLSSNDGTVNWVGNLISDKERQSKKPKAISFLNPFVVKDGNHYTINVIGSNGELYKFTTDDSGHLPENPVISTIDKGIKYYWLSCCDGLMHLILDKKVKF